MPKFIEEHCYITEKDIITNMKNIFGYDCPYFAKMIYLLLSGGYDKAKISMSKFIKEFIILKGEDLHSQFNTLAFKLYDIDHDNMLNVMNLLHLQMNVPPSSLVGKEIFKYAYLQYIIVIELSRATSLRILSQSQRGESKRLTWTCSTKSLKIPSLLM
jgi:hypothetical protein